MSFLQIAQGWMRQSSCAGNGSKAMKLLPIDFAVHHCQLNANKLLIIHAHGASILQMKILQIKDAKAISCNVAICLVSKFTRQSNNMLSLLQNFPPCMHLSKQICMRIPHKDRLQTTQRQCVPWRACGQY